VLATNKLGPNFHSFPHYHDERKPLGPLGSANARRLSRITTGSAMLALVPMRRDSPPILLAARIHH